jgi:Ca2+-binding RTX toxin-like protein
MARRFGRTGIADHFVGIGSKSDTFYGFSSSEGRFGDAGGDILEGAGGNDYLAGGSGADCLYGGADYDTLDGGPGGDVLDGGPGFDTAEYYFARSAVVINLSLGAGYAGEADGDTFISIEKVIGSAFDDDITAHHDGSTIDGWLGNDRIYGMNGDDRLYGGAGIDLLEGGRGHDHLYGGSEVDYLRGESGADMLDGGDGDDFLWGGWDSDLFVGSRGADMCYGGGATDPGLDAVSYSESSGGVEVSLETGRGTGGLADGDRYWDIENVTGSPWDDTITGNGRDNRLAGGSGIDVIWGRDGRDEILGGDAADQLHGEGDDDRIYGGSGGDQIDGGSHDYGDTLSYLDLSSPGVADAGVGVDLVRGIGWLGAEGDTIVGIEHVEGSRFHDTLIGDGGANQLNGWGGNDTMQGGDLNDPDR